MVRTGILARPTDCRLYSQAHANYGQHDRYTDGPLNGVVIEQGNDYGGDSKYVAHSP